MKQILPFILLLLAVVACGERQDVVKKDASPEKIDNTDEKELENIRKQIEADELRKQGGKYYVRFIWPWGVGSRNEQVDWETNLSFIGDVKKLVRSDIQGVLFRERAAVDSRAENEKKMKAYQDETKKVYDERLVKAQDDIKRIKESEKKDGPLVPQGKVVFNDTGKDINMAITSYANPIRIGVYAPIQKYQEGQQDLYSFDATAFGSMSVADRNYVQLGTPRGSAFFNISEGYMEYAYMINSYAVLSKKDQFGKAITIEKLDTIPGFIKDATMMLNYDAVNGISWGVSFEENLRVMSFSIYSNLNWFYGYKFLHQSSAYRRSNLINFLISVNKEKYYITPYLYGSIVCINNGMYIGNIAMKEGDVKSNKPVYKYISDKSTMEGKANTNKWVIEKVNNEPMIIVEDETRYPGVPSFSGLPYAYNWSVSGDKEENLWFEVYSIRTLKPLARFDVKDLDIGRKLSLAKKKSGKETFPPKVKFIRFIGDDTNGLIYFDVKLDAEMYDYAPLVMAVDRQGNLKLLARLWSAVNDVKAIEDGARMGPNFYDYRAVVLPGGGIFTVWNGSKGIGVGKMEFRK